MTTDQPPRWDKHQSGNFYVVPLHSAIEREECFCHKLEETLFPILDEDKGYLVYEIIQQMRRSR